MNQDTFIPDEIRSAGTVPDMLEAVRELRTANTIQAIPVLAEIDRRAIGWLRIALVGLTGLLIASIVLTGVIAVLSWLLLLAGLMILSFVDTMYPHWGVASIAVILLLAGIMLYRSQNMREMLTAHEFWPGETSPRLLIRIILRVFEWIMQVTMIGFVGGLLMFSLLLLILTILFFTTMVRMWLQNSEAAWASTLIPWSPALNWVLFILLVLLALKNAFQIPFVRIILFIAGFIGVFIIIRAVNQSEMFWLGSILIALSLAYPVGLAISLSRLLSWPFILFRNALFFIAQRGLLRWRTSQTLREHCKRNHTQVAGDSWATVCRNHMVRFKTSKVRRSYLRWVAYHHCPICSRDDEVYNGVNCIALLLDEDLHDYVVQVGPTLILNGLIWLHDHSKRDVPVFDAVVVRNVNDHDVEAFITVYKGKKLGIHQKPLKRVYGRVATGHELGPNITRILQTHLAQLTFNYDMADYLATLKR